MDAGAERSWLVQINAPIKNSGLDRGQEFGRVPVRKQLVPLKGSEMDGELLDLFLGDVHGRFKVGANLVKPRILV